MSDPKMSPKTKAAFIKVLQELNAMPVEELMKLIDERPYDPNSIGAQLVEAENFMRDFMAKRKPEEAKGE